jgi:RNA polymerase sigma-70 factor, ECF subfamily
MAVSADELKAREPAAWNRACEEHAPRLYAFILHLVGRNQRLAEELHQECWLAAVDAIAGFEPQRGEFAAWLFAIARHVVVNHFRRVSKRAREESLDERADSSVGQNNGMLPPEILERLERDEVVRASLLELNDEQRDVLKLKYLEGLSVDEIARRTDRSPKAVESMLTRSRERLRSLLRWYFSASDRGEPQ